METDLVRIQKIAKEKEKENWLFRLDYEIQCNCGSPSCRGTITGQDWMRKDLQEKYKGWFCWFLQRKIEQLAEYGKSDFTNPPD